VKFGKTEEGAVWLDPARTSPFRFYQFWLNTDDRDVERHLKSFTFLPVAAVDETVAEHAGEPGARSAQRLLATEVTRMVHGADGLERAERATGVLFGDRDARELGARELLDVFADVPSTELPRARFEGDGVAIVDLLAEAGIAASKGEARRLLAGGGVYLNGDRIDSPERRVRIEDAIDGAVLLLRKGKKDSHVVRLGG
jgi:tyrosyl-tRNA synthetase